MPRALREEVPTALGEDPEGRMTDGGSSPPASIARGRSNGRRQTKHALVQHYVPLLGKGHEGDFTIKMGIDSTILGVHEVETMFPTEKKREWRLSMLVLEDTRSKVVPFHFLVKGIGEPVDLPESGAWNCIATVQSRSGYVWAIFQVWPD